MEVFKTFSFIHVESYNTEEIAIGNVSMYTIVLIHEHKINCIVMNNCIEVTVPRQESERACIWYVCWIFRCCLFRH